MRRKDSAFEEHNPNRILSEEELDSIIHRVLDIYEGPGEISDVRVVSAWEGSTRWARNKIGVSVNRSSAYLSLSVNIDRGFGFARMNQFDDVSIRNALEFCNLKASLERQNQQPDHPDIGLPPPVDHPSNVWSNTTYSYSFLDSGKLISHACSLAEKDNLVSAGYIEQAAGSISLYHKFANRDPVRRAAKLTKARCSVTVRDPDSLGSGWAGKTAVDSAVYDELQIANAAYEKCIASKNPVRIEPGRYTAILEPQAVADMVGHTLFANHLIMDRSNSEQPPNYHGPGPFTLGTDPLTGLTKSKLGLRVFDERINVWHDPADPELGVVGVSRFHSPINRVDYVKNGVLNELLYSPVYSANRLQKESSLLGRGAFRMSGGEMTIDDMIKSTSRGLLVTRFSPAQAVHGGSMLSSGMTRDGLWLIEDGKIKSAVRNFRTLESPIFMLNNIEQLGKPERTFGEPQRSYMFPPTESLIGMASFFAPNFIVPPLKVRDFSFAATIDAV